MTNNIDQNYAAALHNFRNQIVEDLRGVKLTQLKADIPHQQIIPKATYAPWMADTYFKALVEKIKEHTLVDMYRLYELYELSASLDEKQGDILEVGVWRGGSAVILGSSRKHNLESKLWLADTFTGVPNAPSAMNTLYSGGEHADTSIETVEHLLKRCDIDNYKILEGIFPDDSAHLVESARFKFVHVDVDSYESASSVFGWVISRVVKGGIVVFDDYGFWGCEGVTTFVNELKRRGYLVIHNLNGHAILFNL